MRTRALVAAASIASLAFWSAGSGPGVATAATAKKAAPSVRIVNLYAPPDGSSPTIVLVDAQTSTPKKSPKPIVETEFGDTSSVTKVPVGHSLQVGPDDDEDQRIFIDPLKKGDRITVIPYATSDDPDESGLQMLTIVEGGKRQKAGDVVEWPKVPSARATVMFFPGALLSIAPDFGGYVITPGSGCLESEDESAQDLGTGGNVPVFYVVDPGALDVALADDGCNGAPVIGPETLDVSAGDRIALIPYGTSETDLQLLVLPVAAG